MARTNATFTLKEYLPQFQDVTPQEGAERQEVASGKAAGNCGGLITMAKTERDERDDKKAYYEANRETLKASSKAWQKANPEKSTGYKKAYRENNPEKAKAAVQAWQKANPEKAKAAARAYYLANREKILAAQKSRRASARVRTTGKKP